MPYPAYKDSGVEWLGKIPAHWEVKRLKTIADVQLSNVDKKSFEGEEPVRLCNYTDVYYHEQITVDLDFMPATATKEQVRKFTLRAGDVLITKDSESWTDIAVPAVVTIDLPGVLCGYHLAHLRPKPGYVGAFFARAFSAAGPRDQFRVAANGITRFGLGSDAIASGWFAVPPEAEQRKIVAFLDRETARIDALLTKKQRLIALLLEERTALITRSVTKGLDPNVSLKESDIEGLGEIPSHWDVRRADSFLRYEKDQIDLSSMAEEVVFHYSIPSVQEIGDGKLESASSIDSAKLRITGDRLLVSKLNPRKGVVLIATKKDVPTVCSTEFVPFDMNGCELRWALYLFLAQSTRQRLSAVVRSATRSHQRAEISEIVKMWHGVPPIREQRSIATFLDRETARTEVLITRVRQAIGQLRELRTALISAAVTGKFDIREGVV
jgi:type I restriction enzyme S subunit